QEGNAADSGRNPDGNDLPDARPGRAPPAGWWPWGSDRSGAGRHTDEIDAETARGFGSVGEGRGRGSARGAQFLRASEGCVRWAKRVKQTGTTKFRYQSVTKPWRPWPTSLCAKGPEAWCTTKKGASPRSRRTSDPTYSKTWSPA